MTRTPVLIAGGGPVGLTLALELNHHGVDALLVERNETTTRHPKMDITNGRSMELFRRLGVDDDLRAKAVHPDNDYGVIWCTRLPEWELARFDYPSVNEKRAELAEKNDGTCALEPGMRVSQVLLEPILKHVLEERCDHIDVQFGWALESFVETADGVRAQLQSTATGDIREVECDYLAGCDGAGSVTRKTLGIDLHDLAPPNPENKLNGKTSGEEKPARRRLYMIHFRSPDRALIERFGRAWHLQSPLGWSVIAQDDVDTWTIHIPIKPNEDPSTFDPKTALFNALGCEFEAEILVANPWSPRLSLADKYGQGRVWMAGDSVHQVIPTGGYGMNTGIGDAVALGWALAGVTKGWGGAGLLEAYEIERRHVGLRNREASARHAGIRAQIREAYTPQIHDKTDAGATARTKLGGFIQALGNLENEAWGIEWGYRYDASPVICHEDGSAPPYDWETYAPTTWPGGRVPNVFLADGNPLFDHLGSDFTLVKFGHTASDTIIEAAERAGLPLAILDVNDAHVERLYERKLVLLRPDHHCAWRGDKAPATPAEADAIINKIRGAS